MEVAAELLNLQVTSIDLSRLSSNTAWLNDQIINAGLASLFLRHKSRDANKLIVFSSYFYEMLRGKNGVPKIVGENFHGNRNPLKRNIFLADALISPVNLAGNHWALLVVHFETQTLCLYNSIPRYDEVGMECLLKYKELLAFTYRIRNKQPLPSTWRCQIMMDAQVQMGDCDCGVFVCRYFESILQSCSSLSTLPNCANVFGAVNPGEYRKYLQRIIECELNASRLYGSDRYLVFLLFLVKSCPRVGLTSKIPMLSRGILKRLVLFLG